MNEELKPIIDWLETIHANLRGSMHTETIARAIWERYHKPYDSPAETNGVECPECGGNGWNEKNINGLIGTKSTVRCEECNGTGIAKEFLNETLTPPATAQKRATQGG